MKRSTKERGPAEDIVLRLFVSGTSQRAARAIEAVQSLCKEYLDNCVQLEVIDVLEHPDRAETERILATPTLIRHSPGPPRRLIGDLSEVNLTIQLLGLTDWVQATANE